MAISLAFGVLLMALSAGVRIPLNGRLPLGLDRAALDYSDALRSYPPLRDDFVKGVLGRLIGETDQTATLDGSARTGDHPRGFIPAEPPVAPGANDDFGDAAQIQRLPYRAETNTAGTGRETGEPTGCGALSGGTVWFRYTTSQDLPLIAHTIGSSYATALTVYEGSTLGGLRPVGDCNQDLHGNAHVSFRASGQTTYHFQVAAALLDGGRLMFHLERAGVTTAVSVRRDGTAANHNSYYPSISADGRYVSFDSGSTNLVDGVEYECPQVRTYFCTSIFRYDRATGRTELVSASPSGKQAGNDYSYFSSISANGRYVAFMSAATNIMNEDGSVATAPKCVRPLQNVNHTAYADDGSKPVCRQVYVRDMVTRTTRLVSITPSGNPGNGDSEWPAISADGRLIAFESRATDIAPRPPHVCTSSLYTVPVPPSGPPGLCTQVLVRDLINGTTTSVSQASTGAPADSGSWWPSLSADGRYVVFNSFATNLDERAKVVCTERVNDDGFPSNGFPSNPYCANVFVHDRLRRTTEVVSLGPTGTIANNDSFVEPERAISADGRYVAFTSFASNMVPGTGKFADVYLRDRLKRTTIRISRPFADPLAQTNGNSHWAGIAANGRSVVFTSEAFNLVPDDTNRCGQVNANNALWDGYIKPAVDERRKSCDDIFVFDVALGTTTRISVSSRGDQGRYNSVGSSISGDGRLIAFGSASEDLVRGYECGNGGATAAEQYFFASRTAGIRAVFQCYGIFLHERTRPG